MTNASDSTGRSNVRSLTDAIRRVRLAEADRTDVVVELREAERARLDMLADALRDVFAEVPENDEQFIFAVVPGNQPRLWIDMTSFVMLGRDRRTYRFLKDTRLGRTVILESANIDDVADTVTNYIAERIIERDQALEGDWLLKRVMRDEPKRAAGAPGAAAASVQRPSRRPLLESAGLGWIVAAFAGGMLIGIVGLFAYAWFKVPV